MGPHSLNEPIKRPESTLVKFGWAKRAKKEKKEERERPESQAGEEEAGQGGKGRGCSRRLRGSGQSDRAGGTWS